MDEEIKVVAAEDVRAVRRKGAQIKVTTSVLLTPALLARLDRLRACDGVARAQVLEEACLLGLPAMEAQRQDRVRRFELLARRAGMGWEDYARAYAAEYSARTYPPAIEELELLERDGMRLRRVVAS